MGGMVAVNASGPRRFVAGAARDSLLGVRFVNGRGEIVKNGGRVMKNVTGLDLVKPMAGSHGTLGILTEVTLKVQPKPQTETTLALRGLLEADAITRSRPCHGDVERGDGRRASAGTASPAASSTANWAPILRRSSAWRASSPPSRSGRTSCGRSSANSARSRRSMPTGSRRLWAEIRDVQPFADHRDRPVWRISMKPSDAHEAVMALRMEAGASAFYDWQGGLAWVRMEGGNTDDGPRPQGRARAMAAAMPR